MKLSNATVRGQLFPSICASATAAFWVDSSILMRKISSDPYEIKVEQYIVHTMLHDMNILLMIDTQGSMFSYLQRGVWQSCSVQLFECKINAYQTFLHIVQPPLTLTVHILAWVNILRKL